MLILQYRVFRRFLGKMCLAHLSVYVRLGIMPANLSWLKKMTKKILPVQSAPHQRHYFQYFHKCHNYTVHELTLYLIRPATT